MTQLRFHAQHLFDGETFLNDQVITVIDGRITAIDQDVTSVDIVLKGLVAPGFIDLQVNGGGGVLFNHSPSVANIKTIVAAHAQYGTTAMLPTLISDKIEVMEQAADAIAQAVSEKVAGVIGIHFEGPHLSLAKKGTHCATLIRPISDAEWAILSRKDIGQIIVTLAPETVIEADIKRMTDLGINVCLGHTNADFATTQKAIDAGASGFTHLYNAMSPLQGREPGVVGCALLNDKAWCGLIVDGHHVDYASCMLAIKAKPQGKVFLVTDAMPVVNSNITEFSLYERMVYLNDGKLTSTTGELAGSSLDMATAVKNTYRNLKVPIDEALRMASLYPAQYIYQEKKVIRGELKVGNQADMVVLDDNFSVLETWIGGHKI